MRTARWTLVAAIAVATGLSAAVLPAAAYLPPDAPPALKDPSGDLAMTAIQKGLTYLKAQQQPDGGWSSADEPPAVTALVVRAFAGADLANDPAVAKGFDKLVSYQKPDGGIYVDLNGNYNTAIAVTALAAGGKGRYQPQIDKAVAYLRGLQWTDDKGQTASDQRKPVPATDPRYGGWGYGKKDGPGRPDGSNMQFALDALHDAGVAADDPAYKAALAFASRMQNRSESNDQPWATNDGGFIYTPALNGVSVAGEETVDGKKVLRSYGTMTYAGLKSMIYAGLTKDDPRVKAAFGWIQKNWTWDQNPGVKFGPGQPTLAGVFYYYQTAARALRAYGEPVVADAQGNKHDWRVELTAKLASLQKPDGSWVGEHKWMEDNSKIATAFALLALEEAKADLKGHPALVP